MQVVSAVVLPILYLFTCVRIYDKLSQVVYGKALAVWDMFCGTHNNLSKCCEKLGLKPMITSPTAALTS